ncbi:hypothetical protein V7S43_008730 [Phytophthora oleae]|uniref:Uncharacterized protein n=1 Tax=Phytophthora oleae TaxID=2107226 RepID=A0ABD3FHS9_9STRA
MEDLRGLVYQSGDQPWRVSMLLVPPSAASLLEVAIPLLEILSSLELPLLELM